MLKAFDMLGLFIISFILFVLWLLIVVKEDLSELAMLREPLAKVTTDSRGRVPGSLSPQFMLFSVL